MRFLRDDRSQAIQIGAVLLFGILIVFLALYQGFVVPDQNEEIEFDHNQELQSEMVDMRSSIISMPGATTPRSVTLELGVRYPSRTIFTNPGPASGSLNTVGTANESVGLVIENARAGESEFPGVEDFWDGTEQQYNTGAIVYRPGYNLYSNAPRTVYEHSVLYNEFEREGATVPLTGQALIDGNQITLVTLNGSLSENRVGSASVDFKPVSTQTRTVDITGSDENIGIHVPTRLSVDEWDSMLTDEENVTSITESERLDDGVRIELKSGEYQLQTAKVGVGTRVTETEPAYLSGIDGNGTAVTEGETTSLTVEVRDKYNNPVRGVPVYAKANEGEVTESDRTTNRDGQAEFTYNSGGVATSTDDIDFSISGPIDGGFDRNAPENSSMTVTIQQTLVGGTAEQLPGPRPTNLTLESGTVTQGETLSIINASFDNRGTTQQFRGGTDVVAGEFYIEEEGVPENEDGTALDSFVPDIAVTTTGAIDTEDLQPGEYTAAIRAQDTRGIWTNETVDQDVPERTTTFTVEEPARTLTLTAERSTIGPDETNEITVEVTSEDGNPLADEEVELSVTTGEGTFETGGQVIEVTTDGAGEATATYESVEDDADSTIEIDGELVDDEDVTDTVSFEVSAESPGSFSGEVQDGDGSPVADQDVTFQADDGSFSRTVETESDGTYLVADIVEGTYDITASADGFEDATNTDVTIEAGEETENVDFELDEITEGSFSGVVEDDGGEPIGETDVTFEADDGTFSETTETNDDGTYTVEDIEEGTYDITASADGFEDDTNTGVTIEAGEETENVDFELTEIAFFEVTNVDPQDPVEEGEVLDVEITIENTGGVQDSKEVRLDVDSNQDGNFDENVDDEIITLDPGEDQTVTLAYTTGDGDAPEVDVRGDTDDDTSDAVSAEVTLPPGDVNFVASDVGIGDTSQTFTFVSSIGNNDQATIDLSSAQGETMDYTGGDVTLLQQSNNNDEVEYDEENNQIIFTARGNTDETIEIEISGISVVGEVGDTSRVDYEDDAGDEDSDIFEITG